MNDSPLRRVALLGGSFNPPHICHVLLSVYLLETVDVDEVLATVRRGFARKPLAPGVAAAKKKVPRAKLLAYLEREGVAVTHTSSRRARTTRTRF